MAHSPSLADARVQSDDEVTLRMSALSNFRDLDRNAVEILSWSRSQPHMVMAGVTFVLVRRHVMLPHFARHVKGTSEHALLGRWSCTIIRPKNSCSLNIKSATRESTELRTVQSYIFILYLSPTLYLYIPNQSVDKR